MTRAAPSRTVQESASRQVVSAEELGRLGALGALLGHLSDQLVDVGWEGADQAAGELARRLRDTLPPADLARARFAAIPRGGLFVLGLLAYHLGLPAERLRPAAGAGLAAAGPLVLVDDCALTGLRLGQEVARRRRAGEERIVFAHLYSTPELRRCLEGGVAGLEACVAAADLRDQAERVFPDRQRRRAWRLRWLRRLSGESRFWIGLPQPVAFPWGEPDHPFWNPATGRLEAGWRFLPPHRCLKNRVRLEESLPATGDGTGREAAEGPGVGWLGAEGVVWGVFDGTVWLCRAADRRVFSLRGSAALAWKALVCGNGEGGAAAALEAAYGVTAGAARRDVAALAADLAGQDLLQPDPGPPGDDRKGRRGCG